ncbi:MAG: NAD(P)-dependent alcohol dehydrogenase [Paludibacter sp.]|jgi:NADPH:quinone reductase-like Zn-dependent oxidoreductase|nr:NAD(P)-dependent alcohol dehydrogenase [Paludibacter sp.]
MKVIICTKYGSPEVLQMQEIEKPIPKDNEVLIKNFATTVTVADCRVRGFNVPKSFWLPARLAMGITKPRNAILGSELSGVIEVVGKNVTKFKVGDNVFAFLDHRMGAYAEYVCIAENDNIALKPENLTFEQSAALSFGGITALYFLQKANISKGEKVLIYGASGSVGTYAVQLAKYFGAEVTAVCSTENLGMVKNLGADNVIDYTATDLSALNEKFDLFFDAVGKSDIMQNIKIIKPQGRFIHTVADPFTEIKLQRQLSKSKIKLIGGTYNANLEQINFIKNLADKGIIKPVIDKQYAFNEIVKAHKYVDKGHKKGNVVIKIF